MSLCQLLNYTRQMDKLNYNIKLNNFIIVNIFIIYKFKILKYVY